MKKYFAFLTFAFACSFAAIAQDDLIDVNKTTPGTEPPIPVSISGFSGEADHVLQFDLYVCGFKFVSPSEAQYQLSGNNNGHVEGRLTQGGKSLLAKAYNGGSTRQQAHALADDIVKAIRGTPPIFRDRIAFRLQQGGNSEIAVADFDGHNMSVVTHDNSLVATPTWVPGHFELLYCSWKNGATQIFDHDLGSGARRVFARSPGSSFSPAVSPSGSKVAMILDKNGTPNLYVADLDGGNMKQLTSGKDDVSAPSWSPDGQQIVFATRSGRASLTKVNVNGGSPKKLRAFGGDIYGNLTQPDWSPDGKWIVFTCGSGPFSICVAPSAGGEAKRLVEGEDPRWAPNSRTVIFTRQVNHKPVLSLLDVPTKHVKDCTQNSGECSQPAWAR